MNATEKPKVRCVKFNNGVHEWVATVPGDAPRWFTRWRDAFDYAYTAARLRNVLTDVFEGLT
jgi:hypothetical protein